MYRRIIARLDIKGPNLVKGIHLEGLRVLGRPEQFARYYGETGADELLYMDVVASLYGRNSLNDIIERTSREMFIPLCVGGGLRTLDDIRTVLRAGADKVSLNTAAIARPNFIRDAAKQFGSSTIVVSIEAIRHPEDGRYEAYTHNGRESTGLSAFDWAVRAAELGAGELLVTSIDREGTGKGYDLELTKSIAESVGIPVIACGGAGKVEDVVEAFDKGRADAVCLASILHYEALPRFSQQVDESSSDYVLRGPGSSKMKPATLGELKEKLTAGGIETRPLELDQ
jgi:imidazole glycerol-phosphate synthase subunit HisF